MLRGVLGKKKQMEDYNTLIIDIKKYRTDIGT
jgi:hypothetical protein